MIHLVAGAAMIQLEILRHVVSVLLGRGAQALVKMQRVQAVASADAIMRGEAIGSALGGAICARGGSSKDNQEHERDGCCAIHAVQF
jgi:hypothetical protein